MMSFTPNECIPAYANLPHKTTTLKRLSLIFFHYQIIIKKIENTAASFFQPKNKVTYNIKRQQIVLCSIFSNIVCALYFYNISLTNRFPQI